jgi:hypothetical protein
MADDVTCELCSCKPCDWVQFGDVLLREVAEKFDHVFVDGEEDKVESFIDNDTGITVGTNTNQFFMYRKFTAPKHGVLGKGRRKKLSQCVQDGIKSYYPDMAGQYVGIKESNIMES